jgi:hypothetical protein
MWGCVGVELVEHEQEYSSPTEFAPQRKCTKLTRVGKLGSSNNAIAAIEKLIDERSVQPVDCGGW